MPNPELFESNIMDDTPKFFSGEAVKPVDIKRRIHIPAHMIKVVPDKTFYITIGDDGTLNLYPAQAFYERALGISKFGRLGQPDKEKRLHYYKTLKNAHPLQCDQQGRITIPQKFLDYAGIQDKVLIMGGLHKIILWKPEEYEAFERSSELTDQERIHRFGWGDPEDQD